MWRWRAKSWCLAACERQSVATAAALKDIPPSELAAKVVREAVNRAGIESKEVGHVVFGNVIHTDVHDHYLSRVACVKGGLPHETPALTLNRLCGSGLQAIVTAANAIMLGDADCGSRPAALKT